MLKQFRKLKIGFVNLSLEHLEKEDKEEAKKYSEEAKKYLKENLNTEIYEFEKPIFNYLQAREAWKYFQKCDIDAVVIFNGTFSTADLTVEIIRNLNTYYLLWGLEEFGIPRMNFAGSMVGVMAEGAIFKNFNKNFSFIYGGINNKDTQKNLEVFISAIRAISYLKEAVIGIVGMRPDGFEVAGYDELAVKIKFGTTIRNVSLSKIIIDIENPNEKSVEYDMKIQKDIYKIKEEYIEEAQGLSKAYLAIKNAVKDFNLTSYAIDCWPELRDVKLVPVCAANGRCNAEGIMAACEADVDGALTLMLEYAINGNTPWFADYVNIIKEFDAILFWHCGNAPYNLSNDKPLLDRVVKGLAQTSALKVGTVTICRINSIKGEFTIHAALGDAIESKPLLRGSNMLVRMRSGNMAFTKSLLKNGIPHHNGIVYGDITEEISEFASLMNIPCIVLK
jgi:L-fucose isomerase-like protein